MSTQIKYKMKTVIHFLILMLFMACQPDKINLENLLEEMVDREVVARFPSPEYKTLQYSSYDRLSVDPNQPNWFSNADRSFFLRKEINQGREEWVMMDQEGPGAIVRIWMTFGGKGRGEGTLRFYFDGDSIPEIEGNAYDIYNSGMLGPDPLATSVSKLSPVTERGQNLYLPLPFNKSCKITYQTENVFEQGNQDNRGESVYYAINYRKYSEDVKVESFSMKALREAEEMVKRVNNTLLTGLEDLDLSKYEEHASEKLLKPGQDLVESFEGSKAVRSIRLTLAAKDLPSALRRTILEIGFDDKQTVWCPAGDFFGTGYQIRPLKTWYSQVDEEGSMQAVWVMPFKENCNFRIRNIGDQEVNVSLSVHLDKWKWDERSMHFGAGWQQYTQLFTTKNFGHKEKGDPFDLNYVELEGKGMYVGDVLTLFNTTYKWWGEGDEKIYVDGERFPSHFGTGTEDYYGYAWGGESEKFTHPFIAQPDETGNPKPGYVVNLRVRSLDAIPFDEKLKVDMEMWHHQATTINYAPACFYYLRPGAVSNLGPNKEDALAKLVFEKRDIIPDSIISGKIEAENTFYSNSTGNNPPRMIESFYGNLSLSGHKNVSWKNSNPGDTINFVFTSTSQQSYYTTLHLNTGKNFGKYKILMNDKETGKIIDLESHSPGKKEVGLGELSLREGRNKISFVVSSKKGPKRFAMDYIEFE
ncbi:MAG: glycoside hydrolase family 172 protein [bacterium]